MKISTHLTLCIGLVAFQGSLNAGTIVERAASKTCRVDETGKLVYEKDAKGNRLPDFSHVGYHSGEKAIPDVAVRMTGEFSELDCCLIDPDTTFIPRLDVGQFGGRDLLVEYVSCQALIPPTQPVNLYIGINGQNAPVDALIAIELSEQFMALADDSLSGTALHASHAVKLIVDSSDDLLLNGRRPVASLGVGRVSCVVAGRLVN